MTINIPEQYQSLKTKLETIVKKAIIQYELTSSHYNPSIDNTVTLTCKVTNVFGNNIANKTLTLYHNDVSLGTATTDANGEATWSYTFTDWYNYRFTCKNASLELQARGWRTAYEDSNYLVKYTDKLVSVTIHTQDASTINTTYAEYGADVLKDSARNIDLRPRMPVGTINTGGNIFVCRDNSYKIGRFRLSGSATSNAYAHFLYERK